MLAGVVENMSSEVFGSGGGDRLAAELGVPLLGRVPLAAALRESGDDGVPLVVARSGQRRRAGDLRDRPHDRRAAVSAGSPSTLPLVS